MHRCLLISEIIHCICTELGEKSLSRLARTCLAFREPALDALWYELDDLLPLIRCMPSDLWKDSIRQNGDLWFQRPIMPADWTRFVAYAGRVRTFTHCDDDQAQTYRILSVSMTEDVLLLPKLKELRWEVTSKENDAFALIRLFLGPHIERLHVVLVGDPLLRLSFLHTLHLRYPRLTHFCLMDGSDEEDIYDNRTALINAVSSVVCGWSQLRHLSVPELSPVAFHHVAALPTLEQLTLFDVLEDTQITFPRSHTDPFFPCLRKLDVTCGLLSFSTRLVEAMLPGRLTSITVESRNEGGLAPSGYEGLFNALKGHCCHFSITSIIIRDFMEFLPELKSAIIPTHLTPLFVFSNLTRLTLRSDLPFELDNTCLKDMALAWPRIKSLILRGWCYRPSGYRPHVTILGLVPLAQYCLDLQMLTIFFDACSVPPATTYSTGSGALKMLNVLRSPIEEPEGVAAFLRSIFPGVHVNNDSYGLSREINDRWRRVDKLMKTGCGL